MDAWDNWFALAGVRVPSLPRGPKLAHCELTLTAAEQCQGVALAFDAMVRGTLDTGRLVRLFDVETPLITIYSFGWQENRQRSTDILALRDWMFQEIAADGAQDQQILRHAAG